jgi:hypothetical protein
MGDNQAVVREADFREFFVIEDEVSEGPDQVAVAPLQAIRTRSSRYMKILEHQI